MPLLYHILEHYARDEGSGYSLLIMSWCVIELLAIAQITAGSKRGVMLVMTLFGRKQLTGRKPWRFAVTCGLEGVIAALAIDVCELGMFLMSVGLFLTQTPLGFAGAQMMLVGVGEYYFTLIRFLSVAAFIFICNFLLFTFSKVGMNIPKRLLSSLIVTLLSAPYIVLLYLPV